MVDQAIYNELKSVWVNENIIQSPATDEELLAFERRFQLIIPEDLKFYFKNLNGTQGRYDLNFFRFSSLMEFASVSELFGDWHGHPDFSKQCEVLSQCEHCFVFADYTFNMFVYAIRLNEEKTLENTVYILCGNMNRVIATSFTDFVNLYLVGSNRLMFGDE